jgi:hypothetical protein
MLWINKALIPLLIITACAIFVGRYWHANVHCSGYCERGNGTPSFNLKAFEKQILQHHPRILESPFHLAVFLDLDNDCPACLMEASFWVKPKQYTDAYDLTFFVPQSSNRETLAQFMNAHHLTNSQFVYFEKDRAAAAFHAHGVLKVFVSQEKNGVEWYQPGNTREADYRDLYKTLMVRMQ